MSQFGEAFVQAEQMYNFMTQVTAIAVMLCFEPAENPEAFCPLFFLTSLCVVNERLKD